MKGLIVGGFSASMRFLAPAWRGAWAVLGLLTLILASGLEAWPGYANLVWLGLTILAATAAQGALYRLALGQERPGPGGLQWARPEWRLLAATLLTGLFLLILAALAFVVVLCLAYGVASAGKGFVASDMMTWPAAVDERGRVVVSLVFIVCACGLIWAAARVSLAGAATVAMRSVQVLSAWPLSRGVAWRMALAMVLVSLAPAAALAILARIDRGGVAIHLAQGLILAGLWLPLSVGLMAYIYRRLGSLST